MKDHFPKTYVIGKGNPADVTGGASAEDYRFTMQAFLDDKGVDVKSCHGLYSKMKHSKRQSWIISQESQNVAASQS